MQIDCYGFEATSQWFKRRTLDSYLIKRSEGITYLCFGHHLTRPTSRIARDEKGGVRQSWACGRWADAESRRYIPINETMEVKREDYEGEDKRVRTH